MNADLAADEKVCPFCAETIKKAAIRCRYCGSDLPDLADPAPSEPVPGVSPEEQAPEEAVPAEPAATPVVGDRLPFWSRGRLVPALVVLLLAAGALLGLVVHHVRQSPVADDGTQTSEAARAVLLEQAGKMTEAALSYKAKTFDKDLAEAEKLMTPSMQKQYAATLGKVRKKVLDKGLQLEATAEASSIVSLTRSRAQVLEFVNQTTTARGSKNQQLNENRVLVTLVRTDGAWRISKLEAF